MNLNFEPNTLYESDNLQVLEGINSNTIDLIATDPPYDTESDRIDYPDKWVFANADTPLDKLKSYEAHPLWLKDIQSENTDLYKFITLAGDVKGENTAAYLSFMCVRLMHMHRVLKLTGSIYLQCDPKQSHYLKTCMDIIFGKDNFLNEIIWHYGKWTNAARYYQQNHDVIFLYAKSKHYKFNKQYIHTPHSRENERIGWRINKPPATGKTQLIVYDKHKARFAIGRGGYEVIVDRSDKPLGVGAPDVWYDDVWFDIASLQANAGEKTGWTDQKPMKLFERMIQASSDEGDIVLDPFCGSGTTIEAANNLNRQWLGIDREAGSRFTIVTRLMGVSKKERKRLEEYATDTEWMQKQSEKYQMLYKTTPPVRTDGKKDNIKPLRWQVKSSIYTKYPNDNAMKDILIKEFGLQCWVCNKQEKYAKDFQVDHIKPRKAAGKDYINNRCLLCPACNREKFFTKTLEGTRAAVKDRGEDYPNEPIDFEYAYERLETLHLEIVDALEIQLTLDDAELTTDVSKPTKKAPNIVADAVETDPDSLQLDIGFFEKE